MLSKVLSVLAVLCIVTVPRALAESGRTASFSVEIDPGDIICERFLGFGAEWDSRGYNSSGITDDDFVVIRKRVEWMHLPVARIMMQAKWCYKGNKNYDWNNPDMNAFYRHLDVCQRLGTTVFLADWGCEPEWLKCPDVARVDDPKYTNDSDVRTGRLFDYFKKSWQYALSNDAGAVHKPFVVGEAGMNDGAQHPRGNLNIDTVYYGIFMADYAVQAVNAGSSAVLAWMLDDNSHQGFFWGLWTNKEKGLKLRPWFYPWSLLTKCFPPGCRICSPGRLKGDVRVLAANLPVKKSQHDSDWSFCIVNRNTKPVVISLRVQNGPKIRLHRYVFNEQFAKVDRDGFPRPMDTQKYDLNSGANIVCSGNTVMLFTSPGE